MYPTIWRLETLQLSYSFVLHSAGTTKPFYIAILETAFGVSQPNVRFISHRAATVCSCCGVVFILLFDSYLE